MCLNEWDINTDEILTYSGNSGYCYLHVKISLVSTYLYLYATYLDTWCVSTIGSFFHHHHSHDFTTITSTAIVIVAILQTHPPYYTPSRLLFSHTTNLSSPFLLLMGQCMLLSCNNAKQVGRSEQCWWVL